jgi:[acyl-carrier-protein] S-malonyltransferase
MTKANDLALVFPGQGSQKVGMLNALADKFPSVITTFSEASEVLGYDSWGLVQEGSPKSLNLTEYTQPILLTASVAIWRIWQQQGGMKPALMAGHSLGEWSALVCSEVVAFVDAIKLVQQRGQLMQQAVPEGQGAMAAIIGLDDIAVGTACDDAMQGQHIGKQTVAPVNFNAPGQVVIAGNVAAVNRAIVNCKKLGAKRVLPLPVSAPFHTQLMRPAAEQLACQMESVFFHQPRIPIVHNVNAQVEIDSNKIKQLMIAQIYHPVLWVSCVNTLVKSGIKSIVECGPGKVLTGLVKRIDRSLATAVTEDPDDLNNALQFSMGSEIH